MANAVGLVQVMLVGSLGLAMIPSIHRASMATAEISNAKIQGQVLPFAKKPCHFSDSCQKRGAVAKGKT